MARRDVAVRVDGLRDFRRDLKALSADSPKILREAMKDAAQPIVAKARGYAPRRTGRLAESIRAGTSGDRLFVRSRLPYANVHHWGGTIRPRGVPITIGGSEFIYRAVDDDAGRIVDRLGDALERVARHHGW